MTGTSPLVSVVIPTYNRSAYLCQAIRSVLEQSYVDFEVIVVDDGSQDDTRSAVARFADPRVRYTCQDNAGRCAARNAGIRLATGRYVSFLDDDDLYLPNKLSSHMSALDADPDLGLVMGGYRCIDAEGAPFKEITPWLWHPCLDLDTWLRVCPTIPAAVTVRKAWLASCGGFDESIGAHAEDWDLWLRLAYAGCRMAWVEELVCAYRIHGANTVRAAIKQRAGMLAVLDRFFARSDLEPGLAAKRSRVFANAHLRGAARLYAAGLTTDAEQDVIAALALDSGLLDDGGTRLVGALMGWVSDPMVGSPVQYVATVFDHLPAAAAHLAHRRKSALALAAKQALFDAHFRKDRSGVMRNLRVLAANDLKALGDVGIWSAAAEAVLGQAVMSRARRIVHRTRSRSGSQAGYRKR